MSGLTSSQVVPGNNRDDLAALVWNTINPETTISASVDHDGGVAKVSIAWTETTVNIAGSFYRLAAGSVEVNSADVALPTTYSIYAWDTGGTTSMEVVASSTDPEADPLVGYRYSRLGELRFSSVADVETIYFLRRSFTSLDFLLHNLGEYDDAITPNWIRGGALTVNPASGTLSTDELDYIRIKLESDIGAIADGAIILDDEATSVANIELITTYADGSPITAGKYHRLLLGLILGTGDSDFPFIVMRQNLPTVEYTTLAEAEADAERLSASAFPAAYRGIVLPLYYINLLLGDASDLSLIDLRSTGVIGVGGGGATGVNDHGLLAGLGDDDHPQYSRADGTRAFTGDIDLGANAITNVGNVDGVDISGHVADSEAHQDSVTIGADAAVLLGLTGQQLDFNPQADHLFFCGPDAGGPTDPTFRAITAADLQGAQNSMKAYGARYAYEGVATQALGAAAETKLTLLPSDGLSLNTVLSAVDQSITISNTGVYQVMMQFTVSSSVNNVTFKFKVALAGASTYIAGGVKTEGSTERKSTSGTGLLSLAAGSVLTINVEANKINNLTVRQGQFVVVRIA